MHLNTAKWMRSPHKTGRAGRVSVAIPAQDSLGALVHVACIFLKPCDTRTKFHKLGVVFFLRKTPPLRNR